MTTALTTGYLFPIPPLATGGITDGYATLLQEADDHVKGDVNTLSGIVTTLSGSLTTTSGYLTTLSGSLTTLSGSLTTLSGNVTSLSGSLTTTSGYLTTLSGAVTTLSGNVSTLSSYITVAWVDYAATSTITGWSSFTVKILKYKRVGSLVFVVFSFAGESDGTDGALVRFTLPYANAGAAIGTSGGAGTDNNVFLVDPIYIVMNNGVSTVSVYKTLAAGAWTNANTKSANGQFFYEVAP